MINTSLYQEKDGTVIFFLGESRWETTKKEFSRFAEAIVRANYGDSYGGDMMDYLGFVYEGKGPAVKGYEIRFGGHKEELDRNQLKQLCDLLLQFKFKKHMQWEMIGLATKEEESEMNEKFWRYKLLGESAV